MADSGPRKDPTLQKARVKAKEKKKGEKRELYQDDRGGQFFYNAQDGYVGNGPEPVSHGKTEFARTNLPPGAGPVDPKVLEFMSNKDVRPTFSYKDVWKEEHLKSFVIAGVTKKSVLDDVRSSLEAAVSQGVSYKQWAQDIGKELVTQGWVKGSKTEVAYRVRLIFETNMRQAMNAGQWQRAQRTKRILPYFLYGLGPSSKHRDKHAAIAGTVLPIDDPFWQYYMPINGFGCKCWVRQITVTEADSLGVTPSQPIEWEDVSVGGKSYRVPKGIQPGFDYNPGIAQQRLGAV